MGRRRQAGSGDSRICSGGGRGRIDHDRLVTGRRARRVAITLAGAALAAAAAVGGGIIPASAQTGAPVPGAPTNLGVQRGTCGQPATVTWDAPADPSGPVYRYRISAGNVDAGSVPADWSVSDVSGWSSWTQEWTDHSEQLGAGTWGAYQVGVTAEGADGAGPTEWVTVPPCRSEPVTNLVAALVAPDRVRITWTAPPGAGSAFWKYQVYLNIPGWSAWEEDAATSSVEVTLPTPGVLPQVRVATVGWSAGPATWFCDPPSRFCING